MKKTKFLSLVIFITLLLSIPAIANNVENMDIGVEIFDNGDALVTQIWQGRFDNGSENYIVIGNLNGIEIEDFSVSDDSGEFEFVDDWDISLSRLEKSGKCGIVKTDNGFELCFGIGEYGENTYQISYLLKGFMASYTDLDGSNFMYVNSGMSTFPTNVTLNISLANGVAINDKVSDVWGFGFDGDVRFDKGRIVAETYSSLNDEEYVVIMFSLEKGIITPQRKFDYEFERVKDQAFEGSDYSDEDEGVWMIFLFLGVIGIGFIALIVYSAILSSERKKFSKSVPYFRETPNGKKIEMTYFLARKFGIIKDESTIIGASILKMMNDSNISPDTQKEVGFFGGEKETHEIKLISPPTDPELLKLYNVMKDASGEDGILQEKELEKYASRNYKRLRSYIDKLNEKGEIAFCSLSGFKTGISSRIKDLTPRGRAELGEIFGLKKYLEDFSLISEREMREVTVWQDYLVYATLFGIADKVIEQMKKIYPANIPEIEEYSRRVNMSGLYYASMYHSMVSAEQRARSSGSGGRVSFGGGGGFSGGGFGGGSR